MPRIAPVKVDEIDRETRETLSQVKTKLGRVPNLLSTLAHSPVALNGYLGFAEASAGGRLSDRQRELIAIAVAEQNECAYCLRAHAAIGKAAGLSVDEIESARRGSAISAEDAAIVEIALAIARAHGGVEDSQLSQARKAGLDDGLVVEVAANVVLNVLTNTVNRLANTDVDFPNYAPSKAA